MCRAGVPEADDAVAVSGDDCVGPRGQNGLSDCIRDVHDSTSGSDFHPTSKNRHSVTQILHPTTFLEACVLLLHNCLNLSSQNRSVHRTRCRCTNGWEVKFLTR